MTSSPPPPAGWYPDPDASDQQRYWDGTDWTEHTAPTSVPPPPQADASPSIPCPYCHSAIHPEASRCPSCSGELKYCRSCGTHRGVTSKQKFVGMARGGMKTQYRCMVCGRVVDGPRF